MIFEPSDPVDTRTIQENAETLVPTGQATVYRLVRATLCPTEGRIHFHCKLDPE